MSWHRRRDLAWLMRCVGRVRQLSRQVEAAMESFFPIADLHPIYSVAEVDRALGDGAARRNEGLKSWYDRMVELGGSRYIIKPSTAAAVDELHESSPNFINVVD